MFEPESKIGLLVGLLRARVRVVVGHMGRTPNVHTEKRLSDCVQGPR